MMWLWILLGLNISELKGYASGKFPQVCDSMLPRHGSFRPQSSEPPFMISYQLGRTIKDPITVTLKSKGTRKFIGFMLEARNKNLGGEDPPVGKFIPLDSEMTQLLNCSDLPDSAVSQQNNWAKNAFSVNWTAQREDLEVDFWATFMEDYGKFWKPVNVPLVIPTSTAVPSTTQPTTVTTTESIESTTTTTTESIESTTTTTESIESTTTTTTESIESTTTTTTESIESITTTTTESIESTTTTTTESIESITTTTTESIESTTTDSTVPNNSSSSYNITSKTPAISLMCLGSILEEVKMEISNIILVLFANRPIYYNRNKVLRIVCSTLGVISSAWSLFLFIIDNSFNVTYLYVALVSVVTMTNFMEWMFAALPLGSNHELKDTFDLVLRVCFVVHHIFTTVLIFVGVLSSIDESGGNRRKSWLLIVMIAFAAWILLVVVWNFTLVAYRTILQSNAIGNSNRIQGYDPQRVKKVTGQVLAAVSVILLVGTTAFSVAVSVGIFMIPKN